MINLDTIKLVVWDLDDTFWYGTLSEGGATLPESHKALVKDLTDCGIINSICSKNDFDVTKTYLLDLGVWDYFVFPTINWDSKGPQLKEKLEKMSLRPENVLFIDDNDSNLGEAKHYLPSIQVSDPKVIQDLIRQVSSFEKKDVLHKRLNQYKVLEKKDLASKAYSSNEEFLYTSNIQVCICHDCIDHIFRIHELILRSNQLNFTKKRISLEELEEIIRNEKYNCGYITVKDRFGDYGIVGFYAVIEGYLEHFLFSCRTMGQRIEQWVYAQLGFPKLEVVGDVRTKLNSVDCPGWINSQGSIFIGKDNYVGTEVGKKCRVLLKGPCDLSHSQVYIKDSVVIDSEFTYVKDNGQIVDTYNHSVHILGLHTYSEDEKRIIERDCLFVDPKMLSGGFFTTGYDVIILSTLIESSYYIYKKKGTNLRVVFGGADLTNPKNWEGYNSGKYYGGGNTFSREYLQSFAENYECVGLTTPELYLDFLQKCLEWLPKKTVLCLVLGATRGYDEEMEVADLHSRLNEAIISFSKVKPRIRFIEIDDCIRDSRDFEGGINHFSARVYYELAQKMIEVIQECTSCRVESYSRVVVFFDTLVLRLKDILKRIVSPKSSLFVFLKRVYSKVYKNRNRDL